MPTPKKSPAAKPAFLVKKIAASKGKAPAKAPAKGKAPAAKKPAVPWLVDAPGAKNPPKNKKGKPVFKGRPA